MDGVKVALGNRGMTVEAASMRERSERVEIPDTHGMRFTRPFLLGFVFFRTALSCSGSYPLERGRMPLHDAVGINCKKGVTMKIKAHGACVKYILAKGCKLDDCVCVI